jgi:GT2 family glycosyltransferase
MASAIDVERRQLGTTQSEARTDTPVIDLSIVIVSWNTKEFVRQCLGSLRQSCKRIRTEIVVVDNASADGTPEMVEQEFPEVKLIRNLVNAGFAKGNNVGLRMATGRYIALINSDVTVPPACLQAMCEYMDQNDSVGMLGPTMLTPSGKVGASCMRRPTLGIWLVHALGLSSLIRCASLHMENFRPARPQEVDVLNGWFWLVRKQALDSVGLLDEQYFMYGEDIDWCHRFWKNGWRIVYLPGAAAVHFGGGSSARAPARFYVEMQRANMQYWKRYHNTISQAAYTAIVAFHQALRVTGYGVLYAINPSQRAEAVAKVERSAACLRWLFGLANSRRTIR